jgi:hypothetical protein
MEGRPMTSDPLIASSFSESWCWTKNCPLSSHLWDDSGNARLGWAKLPAPTCDRIATLEAKLATTRGGTARR